MNFDYYSIPLEIATYIVKGILIFVGVFFIDSYLDERIQRSTMSVLVQLVDHCALNIVEREDYIPKTCQDCANADNPKAECWLDETWKLFGEDCPNFKEKTQ